MSARNVAVRDWEHPVGAVVLSTGLATAVLVRTCAEPDLDTLTDSFSSTRRYHCGLLARQQRGEIDYLIAWHGDRVVGTGVVTWTNTKQPPALSKAAVLESLVAAPSHRGRGVGTALIGAAEQRIRDRGLDRSVVGVAEGNPRAHQLYRRLGYADAKLPSITRYQFAGRDGTPYELVEATHTLVKELRRSAT